MDILDALGLNEEDPFFAELRAKEVGLPPASPNNGRAPKSAQPVAEQDEESAPDYLPEGGDFAQTFHEGNFGPQTEPHLSEPEPLRLSGTVALGSEGKKSKGKSKSKRVAYSVACTLHVSGSDYEVQVLEPDDSFDKGYRLNKKNASKPVGYNVVQSGGQQVCECSDFLYRQQEGEGKGCKHIRALADMGMFAAPYSRPDRRRSHIFDS